MVEAAPAAPLVPVKPGVLFNFVQQGGTFIVRTLVSQNLAEDFAKITANPEEFPTLRLVDSVGPQLKRLNWFECETTEAAEAIHARIGHRRFPCREEDVCNLSDPGFSWWLEKSSQQFSVHSKMSFMKDGVVRLGPLADAQLAPHRWSELSEVLSQLPLKLNVNVESTRLHMDGGADEAWIVEEFERVFAEGVVSNELQDIFRLLSKRGAVVSTLESAWFFLLEVAAVRRFWIEIEKRLD